MLQAEKNPREFIARVVRLLMRRNSGFEIGFVLQRLNRPSDAELAAGLDELKKLMEEW